MTDERSYFFVLKALIANKKMSRELRFMNLMSSLLAWAFCWLVDWVDLTELVMSFKGSSNSFLVNRFSSASYFSLKMITMRQESLEMHSMRGSKIL